MIQQKISSVHDLLDGIAPLVAVDAEKIVAMALRTFPDILFGVILMFGNPAGLVTLRFWESVCMASGALLRGGRRRVWIIVAGVTAELVHFCPVGKVIWVFMAGVARDIGPLEEGVVHFVHLGGEKIKRVLQLFFRRHGSRNCESQHRQYCQYLFHQLFFPKL